MNIVKGVKSGLEPILVLVCVTLLFGLFFVLPYWLVEQFTENSILPLLASLINTIFWAGFLEGVNDD